MPSEPAEDHSSPREEHPTPEEAMNEMQRLMALSMFLLEVEFTAAKTEAAPEKGSWV